MKNENFITVQGWMINELKLSGNELILYALIYGFSQDGKSRFKGAMQYLADSLRISKWSTLRLLKELVKKDYIKKYKSGTKGHEKCDYGINSEKIKKFCGNETTPPSGEKITPQNDINDLAARKSNRQRCKNLSASGKKITHHINSHIYISSSTTTFSDFCINKRKAQELCAGLDPSWLAGTFSYPEYITETVEKNYPDKPQDEKTRLFITLFTAEDRKAAFPQWRQEQKAALAKQEAQRQKVTAAAEHDRKLETLKKAGPQSCGNCSGAIEAPNTTRGECLSCGYYYFLNEEAEAWEFSEPISLSAEFNKLKKRRR